MERNKRNNFIDVVKGVAIFLMLWGHCIQYCLAKTDWDFFENPVFKGIYSFHMPLFMLVSGYLFFYSFSKRNLKELLVHRTQSLVQPIVFCTIFNFLIVDGLLGVITGNFETLLDGKWVYSFSSLWFLWSVLAASVAVAIVCKTVKNTFLQGVLLLVSFAFVALFPNMDSNLYMYPYFVIGFYFARYKEQIPRLVLGLKYLSLPIFPIMLVFFEKKHYIYTSGIFPKGEYGLGEIIAIDGYRWAIGLVGSIFAITVLEFVYNFVLVKVKKPTLLNGFSAMGKHSIEIYTISVALLSRYLPMFFPKMLDLLKIDNIFAQNIWVYSLGFTLFLAVIYSVGLYIVVIVLKKLRISKIMYGR